MAPVLFVAPTDEIMEPPAHCSMLGATIEEGGHSRPRLCGLFVLISSDGGMAAFSAGSYGQGCLGLFAVRSMRQNQDPDHDELSLWSSTFNDGPEE